MFASVLSTAHCCSRSTNPFSFRPSRPVSGMYALSRFSIDSENADAFSSAVRLREGRYLPSRAPITSSAWWGYD